MIDLALQPKQAELLNDLQKIGLNVPTILGWGGARGAAKSGGLRRVNLARRFFHPGTKSLILRRVFKDLKENHIDKYLEEYPELKPFHRISNQELVIPCGKGKPNSTIVFGYAETLKEVKRKFMGPEYFDIFVDQAEQFSQEELEIIQLANRCPNVSDGLPKTCYFFNPGGIGTAYLRRVFHQKEYKSHEVAGNFKFIQAYGWDNIVWFQSLGYSASTFYSLPSEERFALFIDKTTYGRKLNQLPPSLRAGSLLGNFDSFEGQYFAGVWDESKLIITEDQAESLIQPWWTRWAAIDWGFAHYACCLWAASGTITPKQYREMFEGEIQQSITVVIIYREMTVNQVDESDFGKMIVEATPEPERSMVQRVFLSPDAWGKRGKSNTPHELIEEELLRGKLPRCSEAVNDRVPGWRFMYNCMKQANQIADPEAEMSPNVPALLISASCRDVIEAVPLLVRDSDNPAKKEDVIKTDTKEDDVGDACRYLLISELNPRGTPIAVQAKELWQEFPADTAEQVHNRAMAMISFEDKKKQAMSRRRRSSWARS